MTEPLVTRVRAAVDAGRPRDAVELLARERAPLEPGLARIAAEALAASGAGRRAAALLVLAVRRFPEDRGLALDAARALLRRSQHRRAAGALSRHAGSAPLLDAIAARRPPPADAPIGDVDDAIDRALALPTPTPALTALLEQAPGAARLRLAVAARHVAEGHRDRARAVLRAGLKGREDARLELALGFVAVDDGAWDEAAVVIARARARARQLPREPALTLLVALVTVAAGRRSDALSLLHGAPADGPPGALQRLLAAPAARPATTTTTAPTTTAPTTTAPPTTAPTTTAPTTTAPTPATRPAAPPVSMPPVSMPPVAMPPVSMPPVSMPPVSMPPVSMPPIAAPRKVDASVTTTMATPATEPPPPARSGPGTAQPPTPITAAPPTPPAPTAAPAPPPAPPPAGPPHEASAPPPPAPPPAPASSPPPPGPSVSPAPPAPAAAPPTATAPATPAPTVPAAEASTPVAADVTAPPAETAAARSTPTVDPATVDPATVDPATAAPPPPTASPAAPPAAPADEGAVSPAASATAPGGWRRPHERRAEGARGSPLASWGLAAAALLVVGLAVVPKLRPSRPPPIAPVDVVSDAGVVDTGPSAFAATLGRCGIKVEPWVDVGVTTSAWGIAAARGQWEGRPANLARLPTAIDPAVLPGARMWSARTGGQVEPQAVTALDGDRVIGIALQATPAARPTVAAVAASLALDGATPRACATGGSSLACVVASAPCETLTVRVQGLCPPGALETGGLAGCQLDLLVATDPAVSSGAP